MALRVAWFYDGADCNPQKLGRENENISTSDQIYWLLQENGGIYFVFSRFGFTASRRLKAMPKH